MLLADLSSGTDTSTSPRLLSKYSAAADVLLRVSDIVVVVAAALIAYRLRFDTWLPAVGYRGVIGTTLLYAVICFTAFPLYRSWRGRGLGREVMVLGVAWSGVFALFAVHALVVQMGQFVSRSWLGAWYLLGFVGLVASRTVLRNVLSALRSSGLDTQRVVVIGLRTPVFKLQHYLSRNSWVGLQLVGYFQSRYDMVPSAASSRLPCLGISAPEELERYLQENTIEQVWISMPLGDRDRIKALLQVLDRYPITVKLVPDLFDFGMLNQQGEQIGNVPVINLRQGGVDRNNYFVVAKSLQDKIVAIGALLVLWPLLLAVAIGVKLSSPGPVFFRQKRNGLGGREFYMLKFRSMYVDQPGAGKGEVKQATKGDARITRFGGFLRRTSIDELPQIFNVLGGSMSIVGPRPHAAQHNSHYEKLINRYMQRHYVKPGITGWAQVNGFRGETPELRTMKKRVQYDLDYIRRWSLWLDCKIIVLTAVRVLGQKTAY
ncbi:MULTISPECIES: undecaprenyl-phosphate glucose phosphotransferase [Pseudoxanthomonas]|jgi:undecaprenyl-phosphate glucose phosphotransferase|uniref:Undecaprenyl-phosphate glucose phosphotransferase n=1 Tax=Pseudoxanthomonas winnipegensis TaxID=2480810 RepID=A0A4Q9T9P0_9GAMM|nr:MULTISPECIES: undecaprenyl-phosphate glucose phosphotransferase [Pseudoxanthomonas]MDQ1118416.1 undecaprenyl-phosphate glucose phosphotransferase [Pseudoxanthomonas winnipegensis]MDR6138384.1 undecaprenyl-phosphate glucose phosphotransferase [Pseudoxanthomonas sp. SORGH_AS_0997]RZZ86410.1 undecaprenyl-phosphate glucose phosphotransferase [Pseudoxanthomonas winnipegensis]TAA08219.1 undecaprenyl-phosphate glucose phosphotransferase [Pseudoxanthomonas winnipegensis]TAA16247.1 undecaprenyl-phos